MQNYNEEQLSTYKKGDDGGFAFNYKYNPIFLNGHYGSNLNAGLQHWSSKIATPLSESSSIGVGYEGYEVKKYKGTTPYLEYNNNISLQDSEISIGAKYGMSNGSSFFGNYKTNYGLNAGVNYSQQGGFGGSISYEKRF